MALDFGRMLGQLAPVQPVDFGSGQSSYARQQLELARQQLEEAKRQHQQEREWQQTEEQGRNARALLEGERQKAEAEQREQATLLAQQQGAVQKFGELAGSGKVQQAQAMAPYLDQLGYDMNTLGNVGGLPVFELQNRAQEAQKSEQDWQKAPRPIDQYDGGEGATQSLARMGAEGLGYPTDERGALNEPIGIPSTEDAYGRALAAQQTAADTGAPARGPDEEDFTGAVPRNVIDLPAMNAETNARLSPMLKSISGSLPEALQPGAQAAAQGVAGLGLEAPDALGAYDKAISPAVDIYKQQLALDAAKEKFRETRDGATPKDIEMFGRQGRKSALETAKSGRVPEAVQALDQADLIDDMLDDNKPGNDTMIAGALMDMQAIKGVPSDKDLAAAFGMGKASLMDQVVSKIQELANGGFSTFQRDAIKSFVARTRESQKGKVWDFLRSSSDPGSSYNEYGRQGYQDQANKIVPEHWRAEFEDERDEQEAKSGKKRAPPATPGQPALDAGGLDAEKLGRVIGHESQGDPTATSVAGASGTMQIMPDNLRAMGIEPEEFKKLSAAEQMPYNIRYLENAGITKDSSADDYAMAVAAPAFIGKPPETVVYKKGSKAWEANPAWRPEGGGDITVGSILKFYKGGDKPAEKAAPKTGALPEPQTPEEKRFVELLKKAGG